MIIKESGIGLTHLDEVQGKNEYRTEEYYIQYFEGGTEFLTKKFAKRVSPTVKRKKTLHAQGLLV